MSSYSSHHVHQPTASGSYDSSSVSSTASPQSKVNPNMGFASMTAPTRPSSNLSPFQTSHHPTRPRYTSYDSGSISPNDRSGQPFDTFLPDGTTQEHAGGQGGPAVLHNAKRAYRQRRKDPSCDACRERKVKVSRLTDISNVSTKTFTSATQLIPRAAQSARAGMLDVNSQKKQTDACRQSSKREGSS